MLEKENLLKDHKCETSCLHCTFMLTRGILILIFFFSRISHSYVAFLQPQPGAFQ